MPGVWGLVCLHDVYVYIYVLCILPVFLFLRQDIGDIVLCMMFLTFSLVVLVVVVVMVVVELFLLFPCGICFDIV